MCNYFAHLWFRTLPSIIVFAMIAGFAHAAPNLQQVSNIDGVTVFADHEDAGKYYYLKSSKRLGRRDNSPDFQYSVNRYIGKGLTGDADEFWVRGVIKFSTESYFKNTDFSSIEDALESQAGRPVKLVAAPITNSFNKLVYTTINSTSERNFSGELVGGHSDEAPLNVEESSEQRLFGSQTQRFTIGLSGNDANLFWENFARDNLALSVDYGWTIAGLIQDQNNEWIESIYRISNSLSVDVSFSEYPQLFSKNELWQRVGFAYSGLKVMCYDFINLEHSDLYYVNVEVRFETLKGQLYSKEIKFRANSETYEQDISFELANNIKDGYQYRVRRMTNEGDMTRTDWIDGDAAWIDISMSAAQLTEYENINNEETEL